MTTFEKIESLWGHISQLLTGVNTKISKEEINTLVDVYKDIMPGTRLNTGCGDCIKYALMVAASWYEREKPKTIPTETLPQSITDNFDEVKLEIVEPVKTTPKPTAKKVVKKAVRKK